MDKDVQRVEELHKRYGGVLYDKCLRMLGSRPDAEDAVQETFVNAYRAVVKRLTAMRARAEQLLGESE